MIAKGPICDALLLLLCFYKQRLGQGEGLGVQAHPNGAGRAVQQVGPVQGLLQRRTKGKSRHQGQPGVGGDTRQSKGVKAAVFVVVGHVLWILMRPPAGHVYSKPGKSLWSGSSDVERRRPQQFTRRDWL